MRSALALTQVFSKNIFLLYAVMAFFLTSADGLMSYISPIIIEESLGSAGKMGFVLATSSLAGIFCDFTFARVFGKRRSMFFGKMLFSLALFFPLIFLVWQHVISFVFAMIIWGVYFEAMIFANYLFIHEHVSFTHHAWAWGSLLTMKNLGWVIGPLLAGMLYQHNWYLPFAVALLLYLLSMMLFACVHFLDSKRKYQGLVKKITTKPRSFAKELRIWFTYAHVLWPLMGLSFLLYLIDSSFFSIGPLFSESLQRQGTPAGGFIAMYTIPGSFMGLLSALIARPYGKKRAAFVGGLVGGLGLLVMSMSVDVGQVYLFTFIAAIGISILYPELAAVYEDFVARSKESGSDLIGMTALMGSLGYVVGPIINGMLSDQIGSQKVFGVWGVAMFLYSLSLFFIVKRKVRLPQKLVYYILHRRH